MKFLLRPFQLDLGLTIAVFVATILSLVVLKAIAPFVFPTYYIYFIVGIIIFYLFSHIDFEVLALFSPLLYIGSLILLILPIIFGQVTRGAVRWIPIGSLTIQPAEIVRPFLILFFAYYFTKEKLTVRRFLRGLFLLIIPSALIFLQPSLGVTVLTVAGFIGVVITLPFDKRLLIVAVLCAIISLPLMWLILQPYQKTRVLNLVSPDKDPHGAGYNSIQSMIAVGSGKVTGRGLGKGVQTQLAFLPERHTDFIFASISEELGFLGSFFVTSLSFFLLFRIINMTNDLRNFASRGYLTGVFITLLLQTVVHIGMNMGVFPITGLPLPLISAGGSSFMATMAILGIALQAKSA